MSDSTQPKDVPSIEERKRLVELIITAGGLLGIITAFLHSNTAGEVVFTVVIVLFIITSLRVYGALMMGEVTGTTYSVLVGSMLLSFWALLSGLVEAVVLTASFSNPTDIQIIGVYAITYVVVALLTFQWVFRWLHTVLTTTPKSNAA